MSDLFKNHVVGFLMTWLISMSIFRRPPAVTAVLKYGRSQTVLWLRVGMYYRNVVMSGNIMSGFVESSNF